VQHHVGGYLKIAPEHTESGPLTKMMKPGIGNYDRFKTLFEKFSAEAGKKQFLIPYFIAAHPGTSDEDMMNLAIWLKKNGFRADQVQTFYPSPMATATAMYHTNLNTLKGIHRDERAEKRGRGARRKASPPAQGLSALPRPGQLAAAARGAQGHGPRRPDRQRQAPPDGQVHRHSDHATGPAQPPASTARAGPNPDPAHRPAAACRHPGQIARQEAQDGQVKRDLPRAYAIIGGGAASALSKSVCRLKQTRLRRRRFWRTLGVIAVRGPVREIFVGLIAPSAPSMATAPREHFQKRARAA
jgi:hypothetical protein